MGLHDIAYDDALLRRIIERALPAESFAHAERLTNGRMNVVLRVTLASGRVVIIKLSDQPAKWGIEKEAYLFELVRKQGIPVPDIIWSDFSKREFPYDIMVVTQAPGKELDTLWNVLPREKLLFAIENCGETLAKIHAIQFEQPGSIKGTQFETHETFWHGYKHSVDEDIVTAQEYDAHEPSVFDRYKKLLAQSEPFLRSYSTYCLSHLDFHGNHLFIDDDMNVTCVLDWGFADVGVPERDFVKAHRWIWDKGDDVRDAFLRGYVRQHTVSTDVLERTLFFRMFMDMKFVERLIRTDQHELAEEYRQHINRHFPIVEQWLRKRFPVQKP